VGFNQRIDKSLSLNIFFKFSHRSHNPNISALGTLGDILEQSFGFFASEVGAALRAHIHDIRNSVGKSAEAFFGHAPHLLQVYF
jgi:hypothetical protein